MIYYITEYRVIGPDAYLLMLPWLCNIFHRVLSNLENILLKTRDGQTDREGGRLRIAFLALYLLSVCLLVSLCFLSMCYDLVSGF